MRAFGLLFGAIFVLGKWVYSFVVSVLMTPIVLGGVAMGLADIIGRGSSTQGRDYFWSEK